MNLYKKCTAEPYSFLVIDATLVLDNPSRFRKNLLERTYCAPTKKPRNNSSSNHDNI